MRFTKVQFIGLMVVALAATAPAATAYVVNQGGGGDFTDLNACIAAINSTTDTVYTVTFTDAAPVTYDITGGGDNNIANGKSITMSHATAGIVSILGRMSVSNGGGTFSATNLKFTTTGQWCALHQYDGITLTNCTIGPCNDNGVVIRGGTNSISNCTFDGQLNKALIISGGTNTVTNCTWAISRDQGGCVFMEGPGGNVTVNGGTSAGNQFGRHFWIFAGNLVVNNFTGTGCNASIYRDDNQANAVAEFNDCSFTGGYDRSIAWYAVTGGDKAVTCTLNRCTLSNRADTGADLAVVEARTGASDKNVLIANDSVFKSTNTGGSMLVLWGGGKIQAKNCVLDGRSLSILANANGGALLPCQIDLDHCVVLNASSQVTACSDVAGNTYSVKNTIIDASNVAWGDDAPLATKVVDHNVINIAAPAYATNTATGDPLFVDRLAGNYRIQLGSSASGKGIPSSTLLDIDGKPYDLVAPDCGYFELLAVAEVRDWSLF